MHEMVSSMNAKSFIEPNTVLALVLIVTSATAASSGSMVASVMPMARSISPTPAVNLEMTPARRRISVALRRGRKQSVTIDNGFQKAAESSSRSP